MRAFILLFKIIFLFGYTTAFAQTDSWEALKNEAASMGKEKWRPMLVYIAELHEKSTHPAVYPFDYEWEEIGPGYVYGPAFGHWDIVHQIIDVMPFFPTHAYFQLLNDIKNQEPHGLLPGSIWLSREAIEPDAAPEQQKAEWDKTDEGHPPVWVAAVQDYVELTDNREVLKTFYTPLIRQITWFENERKAEGEGFYYNDILIKKWESGVDEGIRFDDTGMGACACIDATSHVYLLYNVAAQWADALGVESSYLHRREEELKKFIQTELYAAEEGMFYDIWAIKDKNLRHAAYENMWPVVVGAATPEQANRFIDEYLLNPKVFYTQHPISSVGANDPKFELRMWRGPAWNSMTYWAVRGCMNYDRADAAIKLIERALDDSAEKFSVTGTIWEFYHPFGGDPTELQRKPHTEFNTPCKEYLGHNPLLAMARLYDLIKLK